MKKKKANFTVGFAVFLLTALAGLAAIGLGVAIDTGLIAVVIYLLFAALSWCALHAPVTFALALGYGLVVTLAARGLRFAVAMVGQ